MDARAGLIVAGKYQLEAQLARGGMGSVWTARHVTLGSRVAVKFLHPRLVGAPAFIERFEREARAAATLHSPHVVHVQDYGLEGDLPYLVMELLEGEDLGARLKRVGRMSLPAAARLLVQVGKGLRRAHAAGIVHRDLKPANLFLTRVDDEEVVKILDFGIAKETAVVSDATRTGEVMGSPHYMSPEQARGDKGIDPRADVWSLGVLLYRTITGAPPFNGEGLAAVLSRIIADPVPKVATVAPDLPAALDPFFEKALAKAKEQRFQCVGDLVDAFLKIAAGAPETAADRGAEGSSAPDLAASRSEPVIGAAASKSRRSVTPWLVAGALVLAGAGALVIDNMYSYPWANGGEPDAATSGLPSTATDRSPDSAPPPQELLEPQDGSGATGAPGTGATTTTTSTPSIPQARPRPRPGPPAAPRSPPQRPALDGGWGF